MDWMHSSEVKQMERAHQRARRKNRRWPPRRKPKLSSQSQEDYQAALAACRAYDGPPPWED
jgi:hypothetical protein